MVFTVVPQELQAAIYNGMSSIYYYYYYDHDYDSYHMLPFLLIVV